MAAHYLARHAAGPEAALDWNRRALEHATDVGDERVRAFYPSLHLNLAKSYEDLRDLETARTHYRLAQTCSERLPDDGYGTMIKSGIAAGIARTGPEPPK